MDSPEISPQDLQTRSEVNAQSAQPESPAQQSQNSTPINSTPLPDQPTPSTPQEQDTAENGENDTANSQEEVEAAQSDQEVTQLPQPEPQGPTEQQEQEAVEKQTQLATQINLLLTQAIEVVNGSALRGDKKALFKQQIGRLQQEIVENQGNITYPELGKRLAEIGEAVDIPPLQILGLELQMCFAEEEEKEKFRQQIDNLAGEDEKLRNQLPRFYQLFTGKKFDEKNPSLIDIAEGFVEALDNEDELVKRAEQLGFDSEKIRKALLVFKEQKQQIEQAVNEAQKEKKPLWKTAGALGILGILILLFTLIRSALAGEER